MTEDRKYGDPLGDDEKIPDREYVSIGEMREGMDAVAALFGFMITEAPHELQVAAREFVRRSVLMERELTDYLGTPTAIMELLLPLLADKAGITPGEGEEWPGAVAMALSEEFDSDADAIDDGGGD